MFNIPNLNLLKFTCKLGARGAPSHILFDSFLHASCQITLSMSVFHNREIHSWKVHFSITLGVVKRLKWNRGTWKINGWIWGWKGSSGTPHFSRLIGFPEGRKLLNGWMTMWKNIKLKQPWTSVCIHTSINGLVIFLLLKNSR